VIRVINYDAPEDQDAYVHRIGRTGRAGQTGTGISFVLADEVKEMRKIAGALGLDFEGRTEGGQAKPKPRQDDAPKDRQGGSRGDGQRTGDGGRKGDRGRRRDGQRKGDGQRRDDGRPAADGPRRKRRRRSKRKPAATSAG
jgi:superfamily II DNA/RNA helicase